MLPPRNLEDYGQPVAKRARGAQVHDWSHPVVYPLLDDPAVKARMKKALVVRQVESLNEACMDARERKDFNRSKTKEREWTFGAIFSWRPCENGFPLKAQPQRASLAVRQRLLQLDVGGLLGWLRSPHFLSRRPASCGDSRAAICSRLGVREAAGPCH